MTKPKPKAPPIPALPEENPEHLRRYIGMLAQVSLLFPDADPTTGDRTGTVDVNAVSRAIRHAIADCPGVDDYPMTSMIYACSELMETSADLAECVTKLEDSWPQVKQSLRRHEYAQTQACTALGSFNQFVLEQALERQKALHA